MLLITNFEKGTSTGSYISLVRNNFDALAYVDGSRLNINGFFLYLLGLGGDRLLRHLLSSPSAAVGGTNLSSYLSYISVLTSLP